MREVKDRQQAGGNRPYPTSVMLSAVLLCLLLDAVLGQTTTTCSTEGSNYTWSETASATTRTITTK